VKEIKFISSTDASEVTVPSVPNPRLQFDNDSLTVNCVGNTLLQNVMVLESRETFCVL
jgi:hypothetical protein